MCYLRRAHGMSDKQFVYADHLASFSTSNLPVNFPELLGTFQIGFYYLFGM